MTTGLYVHLTRPCRQCGANLVVIPMTHDDDGSLVQLDMAGMCGPCWRVWDFYNFDEFSDYDEDDFEHWEQPDWMFEDDDLIIEHYEDE